MAITKEEFGRFLRLPIGPVSLETKNHTDKHSCVYVLRCGGCYKIGHTTTNVYSRLASLQSGNPVKIELLFTIETSKPREMEGVLHDYFKSKHITGEWFRLSEEDLHGILEASLLMWAAKALKYGNKETEIGG